MLSANTSNTLMNKLGETYRNKFKLFRYSGKKVQLQSEKLLVPLQYTPVPHAEIVFLTKIFSSLAVGKNCPLCSQDVSTCLQALLFPRHSYFSSLFSPHFFLIPKHVPEVLPWDPSPFLGSQQGWSMADLKFSLSQLVLSLSSLAGLSGSLSLTTSAHFSLLT